MVFVSEIFDADYDDEIYYIYGTNLQHEKKVEKIGNILYDEFEYKAVFEILYLEIDDNFKIDLFNYFGFDMCNNTTMINKHRGVEMNLIEYCVFYRHYTLAKYLINHGISTEARTRKTFCLEDYEISASHPSLRLCIENIMKNDMFYDNSEDYKLLKLMIKHGTDVNIIFELRFCTVTAIEFITSYELFMGYGYPTYDSVISPFAGNVNSVYKTLKLLIHNGSKIFQEEKVNGISPVKYSIYMAKIKTILDNCQKKFPNHDKIRRLIMLAIRKNGYNTILCNNIEKCNREGILIY